MFFLQLYDGLFLKKLKESKFERTKRGTQKGAISRLRNFVVYILNKSKLFFFNFFFLLLFKPIVFNDRRKRIRYKLLKKPKGTLINNCETLFKKLPN